MQVSSDVIVFDQSDWSEGLIPQFSSGGIFRGRTGMVFSENLDPDRAPGYCVPGCEPSAATNSSVVSGTIVCGVAKNAANAYLAAEDGEIHEYAYISNTLTSGGGWPRSIAGAGGHAAHASFVPSDFISYRHNSGGSLVTSGFYSYNDATDWEVGQFNFTATFDDDFMSSVPASPLAGADLTDGVGLPHPMEVGPDGIMYIASGRYLHAYDGQNGANGTFDSQVFDLEQGWTITSMLPTERYLLVFAFRLPSAGAAFPDAPSDSRVFWWDYISPTFSQQDDLQDNFVTAAHLYRGRPACFTYGRTTLGGKRGKHRMLVGGEWRPTFSLADYPVNRGVKVIGDRLFVETAGVLFAYGTNNPGYPGGLQSVANLSGATRGMVGSYFTNQVVVSSGSNLQRYSSGFGQGQMNTQYAAPPTGPREKRKVAYVRVYFRTAASGGRTLQINLKTDSGNASKTVFDSGTVAAGALVRDFLHDTSGAPLPEFSNLGLQLVYGAGDGSGDAPAVERIEVFLQPRKIIKQQ